MRKGNERGKKSEYVWERTDERNHLYNFKWLRISPISFLRYGLVLMHVAMFSGYSIHVTWSIPRCYSEADSCFSYASSSIYSGVRSIHDLLIPTEEHWITCKTTLCIFWASFKYSVVFVSSLNWCRARVEAWHAWAITAPPGHLSIYNRLKLDTAYFNYNYNIYTLDKSRRTIMYIFSGCYYDMMILTIDAKWSR